MAMPREQFLGLMKNARIFHKEVQDAVWAKKPRKNVERLIQRYSRQLYSYMDSPEFEGMDKTLGIIFPIQLRKKEIVELVEEGFGEYGISVVWWSMDV